MTDNDKHIEPSLTSENEEEIDLDLEKPQDSNNDDINFDDSDFSNNSDNEIDFNDFESGNEDNINNSQDDTIDLDNDLDEKSNKESTDLDNDFDDNSVMEDSDKGLDESLNDQGSPIENLVKIQTDTITNLDRLIDTSEKFLPDIVDIKNEIMHIKNKLNEIDIKLNEIDENKIVNKNITNSNLDTEEVSVFSKSDTQIDDDSSLSKLTDPELEQSNEKLSQTESKTVSSISENETNNKNEEVEVDDNEELKTKTVTQLTPLGSFVFIILLIIFLIGLLAFVEKTSGLPNVGIIKILKPAFKVFEPLLFFL